MIARFTGAILGLLAFSTATVAGLAAGNPPAIILSRALWAMFLFCVIGLAIGFAAQIVVREHDRQANEALILAEEALARAEEEEERAAADNAEKGGTDKDNSIPSAAEPMGKATA